MTQGGGSSIISFSELLSLGKNSDFYRTNLSTSSCRLGVSALGVPQMLMLAVCRLAGKPVARLDEAAKLLLQSKIKKELAMWQDA